MHATRRDLLAAAGAAGVLPLLAGFTAPAGDATLRATVDGLADAYLLQAPETATNLGLDRGARAALASRLDDRSPAGRAAGRAIVVDYRARLAAIARATLTPEDQILRDSVAYALDLADAGAAFPFGKNGFRDAMGEGAGPYVVDQQHGGYADVPEFLDSQHRVETAADAEAYLARLAAFATVLDQETAAVTRDAGMGVMPPDFILDNAIRQRIAARALPTGEQRMVTSLATRAAAKGIAGDWTGRATKIASTAVLPALDRQIAAMQATRPRATHDAGLWKLPHGEAYYAWLLRVGTTTSLDAATIHATGLEQNLAIQSRMDPLLKAQGLTKGTVGERVAALTRDPRNVFADSDRGRAELLAYLNGLIAAMRPRMTTVSKLGLKAGVTVKRVPVDIQDGAAQGYMQPAALDGSRPATYYINLKSVANWPRFQLGTLTAHETIPGHAWQFAYLAEHHAQMPVIDSIMGFNAFVEGWALYAEQLADELGAYDDDPLGRLGYLQGQQFRACRLVVDTGLHAMRWTREQSVAWLHGNTGRAVDGLTSEVDRYCATPGQACGYKVGHNEILRLRDKARSQLGPRFDLAAFDDAIVTTGGVPLAVLATAIDMHIAQRRGLMAEDRVIPVPAEWSARARIDTATYDAMYAASVEDPETFWRDQGRRLDWMTPYTRVKDASFDAEDFGIRWYADGVLNVAANCLDRHLATRGDQVAILWEPDDPAEPGRSLTYRALHAEVCRLANAMKTAGVARGDRVTLYLPMIPEAAVAMLACARIGAIHSVVFAGFSPEALASRIDDYGSTLVITADEGRRGGRPVPLKANLDAALARCPSVRTVLVVRRTGGAVAMTPGRDAWYDEALAAADADRPPEAMSAEDPLFILYTSGSTGKPKGVLHTSGGYLVWASLTHELVFDYRAPEVYWCAADVGWVTGHSYVVYGPLANGATTLMFEGIPTWPTASRFWEVVDKHQVTTFYGAPTALRALMREGDDWVTRTSRKSLTLLGSVGEPINPEAWSWYHRVVGDGRCPIVDTWWQTETGGIMITPLPGATDLKPGSASKPFFGVRPALVDAEGALLDGAAAGNLVLLDSWPGQMRTVWGDDERFFETYFTTYPGKYFTGDGCRRDADGYYWITGRVDDVINVSGHRLGTAEIESALVAHARVAEAAVVGMPHDIKGQGIYAYVTLNADTAADETLRAELVAWVRREIGPIATPDVIQFAPALPKTRSGKIMRRILRKIAEGDVSSLGDTSTLADPAVVDDLVANRVA